VFHIFQPTYNLSGLAVGILVGLTGVGGGSLMTPLLVLVFGMHASTAVGTDLIYAAGTKVAGTATHGWSGSVDWKIVGRLAAGSLPTAALTLILLSHLGAKLEARHGITTLVLGAALILTAISIVFRRFILDALGERVAKLKPGTITALTVLLGAIVGVLVTISSVGAGAIGMTVLVLLYPKTPVSTLVGSDIAYAVPLTLLAGLGHGLIGQVNWVLLLALLVGSIPGVIIGSLLATRTPDHILRPVLASTLALVGAKLLF
jgi:uncharacterized membrane protein YfcA